MITKSTGYRGQCQGNCQGIATIRRQTSEIFKKFPPWEQITCAGVATVVTDRCTFRRFASFGKRQE